MAMAASRLYTGNEREQEHDGIVEIASKHGCVPSRFILPPVYCSSPATIGDDGSISLPTVDLSALDDPARSQEILAVIDSACREWGFFQVLNHGVPSLLLDTLRKSTEEFFALSPELKRRHGVIEEGDGQGFGTAFVNPTFGTAEWRDYLIFLTHPESKRNYSKWPPMFRDHIAIFSRTLLGLSKRLLSILSQNLQLPGSYIEEAMVELNQKVLVSHYPPCPRPDVVMGSCEHTDIGIITFVWQVSEEVMGLEICKGGKWYPVRPVHDTLVVNVADQIEILSNGIYKSVPHRVVLNNSKSRFSIVTFLNPAADAKVLPAPCLIDKDHPSQFQVTEFKSYALKNGIKVE